MHRFTALLLAAFLCAQTGVSQSLINRRAPSFSLPDPAFKQYDLLDYRGKWLFIEFMNTNPGTCPSCKDLSKKLDGVQTKYGARVAILAIVTSPPENQQTVAKYILDTKTTTPIVFDMSQVAISYFKATPQNPAFDTPHIFAINPQGTIVKDWNQVQAGAATFLAEIDQLLAAGAGKASKAAK